MEIDKDIEDENDDDIVYVDRIDSKSNISHNGNKAHHGEHENQAAKGGQHEGDTKQENALNNSINSNKSVVKERQPYGILFKPGKFCTYCMDK